MISISRTIIGVALLSTPLSTLSVYPHELAYFNEGSGGPETGHKHLLHSNLDWGQDLLLINSIINDPRVSPILMVNAEYNPADIGVRGSSFGSMGVVPGVYVVSENFLAEGYYRIPSTEGGQIVVYLTEPEVERLKSAPPVGSIRCYSMRVVKVQE